MSHHSQIVQVLSLVGRRADGVFSLTGVEEHPDIFSSCALLPLWPVHALVCTARLPVGDALLLNKAV